MRNNEGAYMKKSSFLLAVREVYQNATDDYLLALSNALQIIVARRHDPTTLRLEDYQGYVKYL